MYTNVGSIARVCNSVLWITAAQEFLLSAADASIVLQYSLRWTSVYQAVRNIANFYWALRVRPLWSDVPLTFDVHDGVNSKGTPKLQEKRWRFVPRSVQNSPCPCWERLSDNVTDDRSPFWAIEKGAVLQEARCFNDNQISTRRCQQVSAASNR